MFSRVWGSAGNWPAAMMLINLHQVLASQPDAQSFLSGSPLMSSLLPRFSERHRSCLFIWIGMQWVWDGVHFLYSSGMVLCYRSVAKTVLITQHVLATAGQCLHSLEVFSFSLSAPVPSK